MNRQWKLYVIALSSALTGLLFGYDAGIISGALLFINESFSIPVATQGWLVAMVPLGALCSSLLSGQCSDYLGRKKTLYLVAIAFALGSYLCIIPSPDINYLMFGRLLLGVAIGVGSCVSPVYTSEIANEEQRGWLVNLFVTFIQLGIFLSFVVSYLLTPSKDWQLMISLGIFPAILLLVAVFFLPESPRWLVLSNQPHAAQDILASLYGDQKAKTEIKNIQEVVRKNKINLTLQGFLKKPQYFKVLFIGVSVSVFTQTVGINAFNYYAPTIFKETGFASPESATFYTMFMGLTLAISTLCSLFFIDKIGRRKPLIFGTVGILFTLLAITIGFSIIKDPHILGWVFFLSAIVFMAFHGISIGPACFLIPSEVFPIQTRGLGMGFSVACNWASNVAVAALVPPILFHFGVSGLFAIFLSLTLLGLFIFYYFVPETKGVSLEEIEHNLLAGKRAVDLGYSPSIIFREGRSGGEGTDPPAKRVKS